MIFDYGFAKDISTVKTVDIAEDYLRIIHAFINKKLHKNKKLKNLYYLSRKKATKAIYLNAYYTLYICKIYGYA